MQNSNSRNSDIAVRANIKVTFQTDFYQGRPSAKSAPDMFSGDPITGQSTV